MATTAVGPKSSRVFYLAPVILLAHQVEEWPGLRQWLNRHVEPDISQSGFVALNAVGLLITVTLAAASARRKEATVILFMAWLGFLMLANGLVHLAASLAYQEYVPGTVTGVVLYLPYFLLAASHASRHHGIPARTVALAAMIGAVPMALQAVTILAAGRRLLW